MKAYDSAIKLVSALLSTDRSSETLLYLPYYHFRCLLTAACILVKVLKSSYAQELEYYEKGRGAFNDAVLAIMRSSISNNDTAGKAAQMLSRVWHNSTATDHSPPQLTVQSRFGAR
jgi:transcriptional regulatory protein LEU3